MPPTSARPWAPPSPSSTTLETPGALTSNIVGKGTGTVDNRPFDDELTSVTVTVDAPLPRPAAAVVLPKTGTGTRPLLQLALGSVALGAAFTTAGRRRR